MALDGMFLSCQKEELTDLIGNKVDKIYQPSKEEVVLFIRQRTRTRRLLICARANSPRISITNESYENPMKPPMFCMLLRKYLTSATLKSIDQLELDRVLILTFDSTNDIGDKIVIKLIVEIMGTYSNIIMTNSNNIIIDCLKRTDSFVRRLYPGVLYSDVPIQEKINILSTSVYEAVEKMKTFPDKKLSDALLSSVMGASPALCKHLIQSANLSDKLVNEASIEDFESITDGLSILSDILKNNKIKPCLIYDKDKKKTVDFSFIDLMCYDNTLSRKEFDSLSLLLDAYYSEKDNESRVTNKTSDLRRTLTNAHSRITKKIKLQTEDLKKCSQRETLRINAELISANLYRLSKGTKEYEIENYYDDNKLIKIPVDPALSPNQNAQKYYKEYKKTYTAEKMLTKLISSGEEELIYIDSVLDSLTRVQNENEIAQIKNELQMEGYLKKTPSKLKKQKLPPQAPPIEFLSTDGYRILVGRNNIQNEKLSLKTAQKNDMWLHVKDMPGSHVIIESKDGEISETAILEAAKIAGLHSKAKSDTGVSVDYTLVKNLKKPAGSKPGKVIYNTYHTILI